MINYNQTGFTLMSIYTYIFTYTYRFIHIKRFERSYWTVKNTYRLGTEIYFVCFARVLPSPASDSKASQSNKSSLREGSLGEDLF